jgi:subtilisin family serine protease
VASIILQSAPNIQIMPIRVLDDYGRGTNENMFKGIKYAIDHGAKIINLSLGGTGITSIEKSTLETIISMARAKNILVIAAAGNESSNNDVSPIYPSNVWSDNLLSICSVDKTYHLSLFSNFGDKRVHVCAYGENILAANFQYYSDNKLYIEESGTSMATPFVAGLAALILSNNPNLLPYQVRDIIMNTSTSFSFLTGTSLTGGVINALEAVKY